jgi:photosynthetic reaction center cytochrome c subunit
MRLLSATAAVCIGIAQFIDAQQSNQKTAAEVFKNVQVLKRVPADQWFDTMAFIAGSLGVTCDHCHTSSFDVDDGNPAKLKAREMMRMVDEINRNHFDANTVVTCNTCHRGTLKPQHSPVPNVGHWKKAAEKVSPPPPSAEILARYHKLIRKGTRDAVLTQSVSLQIATYNGTAPARQSSLDVLVDGPDKIRTSTRDGQTVKTLIKNGHEAWINEGAGWRAMDEGEASTAFEDANILSPDQVGNIDNSGAVFEDQVNGERAYVIPVESKHGRKWFFFDANSGVLLRKRIFFPSFYGDGSVDFEYADYRNYGKAVLPTIFQIVNAGGAGLTISHATSRRVNIGIKDSEFETTK